jgi:hypothetical protein
VLAGRYADHTRSGHQGRGVQRVAGIEHELAEHEEWAREFETSQDPLSKLAAEARSDRTGSRVTDIDPDRL